MTTPVGIIGAGGYGREILEYAADAAVDGWDFEVVGFFDDRSDARDGFGDEHPVLGSIADIEGSDLDHFVVALGEPRLRRSAARRLEAWGKTLTSVVHPTAYVSRTARVGPGAVLCPFTLVGAHSTVGRNISVNVYGSIGHDSVIGDDCVVSPYVAVTGTVRIGDACFFGTHATLAPGIEVGAFTKVMAGSFVHRSAPAGSLLAGSPAKGRVMFGTQEDVDA